MRQSHTIVVERNTHWTGDFEIEPCEVGWAREAIYFVRTLTVSDLPDGAHGRIQISPDGIHWADEGRILTLPNEAEALTFTCVDHFGGWLRVVGTLPQGAELRVIVYLVLKE